MDTEQSLLAKNQGYLKDLGFGMKPALFISDMQNAYINPSYPRGMDVTKEIDVINEVIIAGREKKIPIFFSTIAFDDYDIQHPNIWMQKINGLTDLKLKSDAVNISQQLNYDHSKDKLIIKQYPSAFFSTTLASELINKNIDTLIIMGCSTSGCVRTTTIDCLQHGFRPMVVENAVADRWENSHNQALFEMKAKYADVIPSTKVIDYLTRLK